MPAGPSIESVNSTSASDWSQEGEFVKGMKITAFVFLMLLSMLGNVLLIAVVYKNANQRMRTPSNYFIFNMACADVLLTVYTVPDSIVDTAYSHQWLITGVAGELLCRLSQFIGQMSVLVSTASLLVTALDRFFLVFYPLKRIITLRIARFLIGVIWIFAIVFTVPLFKMTTLVEFKPDFQVCTFNFGIIGYVIIYLLFCYPVVVLLPIIAIILIYAAIGFKLKHTIAPGNQLPSNQHRREQMNRKILAMLVTVVVVLIVCRFPLIFGTMACFSGLNVVCSWNSLFLGWFLVCFNSGINPWIYFIFNEQFRQGAKLLLQKLLPRCFKVTNEVEMLESTGRQIKTHTSQTHVSSHAWSSRYSPPNK